MPFKYSQYQDKLRHSLGLRAVPIGHYTTYYQPVEALKEVHIITILCSEQAASKHLPIH